MSEQRQLAAIMFTDIEGYTAQMGADERRAIAAVQRSRREQRALVEDYGGKWLQEIGDGALCTFPSAVAVPTNTSPGTSWSLAVIVVWAVRR